MSYQRPCVRCGLRSRSGAAFLCEPCRIDPITQNEVQQAKVTGLTDREQRHWLVTTCHWRGRWGPRG